MDLSHKPQRTLSVLLAVVIIFAVNAPVFLQRGGALLPDLSEDTEPYSEPYTDPEPYSDPSTEPSSDPEPYSDPATEPYNPWSDYTDDEPYSDYTQPTASPYPTQADPDPVTQSPASQTPQITYQPPTAAPVPETTTAPNYILSPIEKYNAVQEFFTDTQLDDQNIASAEKDQNAIHIGGGNVIINNSNISRVNNASTSDENAAHYGVGAVVLATNGVGFISKTTINSEAKAANGAFAYGSAKLFLADTAVTTALEDANGLKAAETGSLFAWNMTVQTLGENASPIYAGPGGGAIVLNGGSYASTGIKSPAVFSAGDTALSNAELTAAQSEAAVVENASTLTLCDVNLTGDQRISEEHPFQWTVLLYQSGKVDPAVATNFYMKNGTLTSKSGGLFYTTNTTGNIYLENVTLKPYKNSDFLVRCTGNSDKTLWGEPMKNGAVCNFTAVNQQLEGNVVWDTISRISLYVKDGSVFTGAFLKDSTFKTGAGSADLYIGQGCTWVVAGDSVLSNLYNAGSVVDTSGNTVTIKKADGTVILGGESAYTIVVDAYQEKADMGGAQKAPDWTKTTVARPAALGASLAEITTEEVTEPSTTPAKPDEAYEHRKELAKYVLIAIGAVAVGALGLWAYQANKYKLKKKLRGQE